jgi:predicted DNA-binding transcriptional regulator AlpA
MSHQANAHPERRALTIKQFCAAHAISRAFFYKLLRAGQGPRIAKIGRKTIISDEAAAEWLRGREVA